MTNRGKLISRLLSRPNDFRYSEAVKALRALGFEEVSTGRTSGSRVRFEHGDGTQFRMHRPHPDDRLPGYVVSELAALAREYTER